jgi:hypothetical protein
MAHGAVRTDLVATGISEVGYQRLRTWVLGQVKVTHSHGKRSDGCYYVKARGGEMHVTGCEHYRRLAKAALAEFPDDMLRARLVENVARINLSLGGAK